jgi:hypothetical protein
MAGRIPCLRAGTRLLFHSRTVERVLAQRAATGDGSVSDDPDLSGAKSGSRMTDTSHDLNNS